jgi:hypothetical protein
MDNLKPPFTLTKGQHNYLSLIFLETELVFFVLGLFVGFVQLNHVCSEDGRGKLWTGQEIKVLREMAEQRLCAQEIYESGKLPDRTYEAIKKQLNLDFLVETNRTAIVGIIEPAWNRILLPRQKIQQLPRQLSLLRT